MVKKKGITSVSVWMALVCIATLMVGTTLYDNWLLGSTGLNGFMAFMLAQTLLIMCVIMLTHSMTVSWIEMLMDSKKTKKKR